MHAAVVTSFDSAPRYGEFTAPTTAFDGDMVVDVIAAGLHPRVRSQADGSHYTATGELPFVPGIDGVGRGPDGRLRYFILPDTTMGSMADKTLIDSNRSLVLPDGGDPVAVAAAMNPAMSSWLALRRRIDFTAGHSALILGATGNAGRMAIQVATLFGAGSVVAAGRGADRLEALRPLGATRTVDLAGDADDVAAELGDACADVDVVIDYLWGPPTAAAMSALASGRTDHRKPLTWIEIGAVAGAGAEIPSAALRSTRLDIVGSGQGSLGRDEILAELPALAGEISKGTFDVDPKAVPLSEVEEAWKSKSSERVVFTPGA